MFSINEVMVIVVIAFIVLGPEQFPKMIKRLVPFFRLFKKLRSQIGKSLAETLDI